MSALQADLDTLRKVIRAQKEAAKRAKLGPAEYAEYHGALEDLVIEVGKCLFPGTSRLLELMLTSRKTYYGPLPHFYTELSTNSFHNPGPMRRIVLSIPPSLSAKDGGHLKYVKRLNISTNTERDAVPLLEHNAFTYERMPVELGWALLDACPNLTWLRVSLTKLEELRELFAKRHNHLERMELSFASNFSSKMGLLASGQRAPSLP